MQNMLPRKTSKGETETEQEKGRRKNPSKMIFTSQTPASAWFHRGDLGYKCCVVVDLLLVSWHLMLSYQSLDSRLQGVGSEGGWGVPLSPGHHHKALSALTCITSGKAAPENQGRVSGETLYSKESRIKGHPKIVQGPKGIYEENH